MMNKLRHSLEPPVFAGDEEKTRAAIVLNALQLTLATTVALSILAVLFVFTQKLGSIVVIGCLLAVLACSRWLMFRGSVRASGILTVWGLWVIVTVLMFFAGGIRGIDAVFYVSITVIGGLLLGTRAATVLAGVSCVSSLVMVILESVGYPLPQFFPIAPHSNWVKFIASLLIATMTLNIALKRRDEALSLAHEQLIQRQKAEAALFASEARLRAILEAAIDISFVVTDTDEVDPKILEFSAGAERMFGYGRDEVIGAPVAVLHIPENIALFPRVMRQMRMSEKGFEGETRLVKKSGETFDALLTTYPLFGADGVMRSVLGIGLDITQNKRTVDALRASEIKFRQIVESSPLGIHLYEVDAEERLIFTGNNPAADRILGTNNAQFVGQTLEEAFPPLAQTEVPARYRRAALDGIPWHTEQIDYAHGRIHGAYEVFAFQTGERRVTVMFSDVTERIRAGQEREQLLARIQEQAHQVQQIVDTVPEGVVLLDTDFHVMLMNPVGERDVAGLTKVNNDGVLTSLGERTIQSLLLPPPGGLWHELHHKSKVYELLMHAIESEDVLQGWLLVTRDVTQQRDTERRVQQQERLAAVGQLAAGIAHDFNNIMATIVLYTQMSVMSENLPSRVAERLHTIQQQAMHAARLTQQILDFSRRAIVEREPIDLLLVLQTQVEILRRTLPENIVITLMYAPGDYIIHGSATYIQQVIMNLAVNARDAMPGGGKLAFVLDRLHIDEEGAGPLPDMPGGDWLRVTVTDTGHGISPDVVDHIFEPFFTTKDPGHGTGLGLAQVHGIIGMHGGYIEVETLQDSGTTFVIYLPALALQEPETKPSPQADELLVGQGQLILVVEDNPVTQMAVADSLKALNYRIRTAYHGYEALTILDQSPGDVALVVSDVVMPEMGGIGLLKEMVARAYRVPVILLTGHPLQEELAHIKTQITSLPFVDWVLKPPSLETLSRVIARALAESASASY